MTSRQITAIALRILAIWVLIQLAFNLPYVFAVIFSAESFYEREISVLSYVLATIAYFLVGILIARIIYKSSNTVLDLTGDENDIGLGNQMFRDIFQLVGFYFVIEAFINVPQILTFFFMSTNEPIIESSTFAFAILIQFIIGFTLIIDTSRWVYLFNKLRGRV